MQHDRWEALEAATGVVEHIRERLIHFPFSLMNLYGCVFVEPNSSSKLFLAPTFPFAFFC